MSEENPIFWALAIEVAWPNALCIEIWTLYLFLALVLDKTQILCAFSFTQNKRDSIKLLNLFWNFVYMELEAYKS